MTCTARQQTKTVETIPWSTWAKKQTKRNPNSTAKLLFLMATDYLHQNWITPCPLALIRKGNVIQAKAKLVHLVVVALLVVAWHAEIKVLGRH